MFDLRILRSPAFSWFLVLCVMGVVAAGALLLLLPRTYEARSKIWIQRSKPYQFNRWIPNAAIVPTEVQQGLNFDNPITTAAEIAQSDVVLTRSLERLKNEKVTEGKKLPPLDDFQDNVEALPMKDTDMIEIRVYSKDEKLVLPELNAVVQSFIDVGSNFSSASARGSREYLEQQLAINRERERNTEERLKKFCDNNHAIDLPVQIQELVTRAGELEQQINDIKATISQERQEAAYLEKKLGLSSDNAFLAQKLGRDQQLLTLQKQEADDTAMLADLRSRLTENHPNVRTLESSLQQTKEGIKKRLQEILGTPSSVAEHLMPSSDPVREKLLEELALARTDIAAQESRLSSLVPAFSSLKERLSHMPNNQVQLAELQRSQTVASDLLTQTEESIEAAKLMEGVDKGSFSVLVAEKWPEAKVSWLKTITIPAIAFSGFVVLAGLVLVIGGYADPILRSGKEAAELLGKAPLGWIGKGHTTVDQPGLLRDIERCSAALALRLRSLEAHRLVVTSPDFTESKCLVAAALGSNLASTGSKVLLVETDANHPALHTILKVNQTPGLLQTLNGARNTDVRQEVSPGFSVVTSGATKKEYVELSKITRLIDQLVPYAETLIVDASPTDVCADAITLSASGILLLLVHIGKTKRQPLQIAAAQLRQLNVNFGWLICGATERDFAEAVGATALQPKRVLEDSILSAIS